MPSGGLIESYQNGTIVGGVLHKGQVSSGRRHVTHRAREPAIHLGGAFLAGGAMAKKTIKTALTKMPKEKLVKAVMKLSKK